MRNASQYERQVIQELHYALGIHMLDSRIRKKLADESTEHFASYFKQMPKYLQVSEILHKFIEEYRPRYYAMVHHERRKLESRVLSEKGYEKAKKRDAHISADTCIASSLPEAPTKIHYHTGTKSVFNKNLLLLLEDI